MPREVELLSPARDAETARKAIRAGADAVYMGAPRFGAREAAANSVAEIAALCRYAHLFSCRVYVALNTILTDSELEEALSLARELADAGVDAFIVQDLGLVGRLPENVPLYASTQCNIADADKAKFLESLGFDTLVLARELSLDEIAAISRAVKARIECFVHGALCVSYSGQCYLSLAAGSRSGNRGRCAQPCRMKYSLTDAEGKRVAHDAYYLCLRDMNRLDRLGDLLDAGVVSFKIEGRLKDSGYVRNVTAAYSARLSQECSKRGFKRSSFGGSVLAFKPDVGKSFNRGFCDYNLERCKCGRASFGSCKSRGERMGVVKRVFRGGFELEKADEILSNGDGLFFEACGSLDAQGALVNSVKGNRVLLGGAASLNIRAGTVVYRNKSAAFERALKDDDLRVMAVEISAAEDGGEYVFKMSLADSRALCACVKVPCAEFPTAENPSASAARIGENLSKLGGSVFACAHANVCFKRVPFMNSARINAVRRELVSELERLILAAYNIRHAAYRRRPIAFADWSKTAIQRDYTANVLNKSAKALYAKEGIEITEPAPESGRIALDGRRVMLTKHCILGELGFCKKDGAFPKELKEPLYLANDSARLEVRFDCNRCGMSLFWRG